MKICLVTAFPPSREALNEYGFHIARELQAMPGLSLTILGDDFRSRDQELEGFPVVRCWAFNSLRNPFRLLRAIRKIQPDVVWFNLGFASFGGKPLPAFVGIGIPAMVRMAGFYTHVTLHQLMETVDLKDAGVRFPLLYRAAGFVATQLLLLANSVSVLLPAYRSLIREKYHRGSVYVRRHGILSGRPEYPDFSQRGNPQHRILAFGKWGTYKRLEPMIEAFEIVARRVPNVELVIGGTDHPKAPGYLESIAKQSRMHPQIRFAGYVAEEKIGELFQSTSIAVMPYTSSAGSSGVAHLACAYGVPIVASDIADFRQLADEEGLAIKFFRAGDVQSLAESLIDLLASPENQPEMAIQNFSAALRMSMPEIIRQYLRTFDLQQHLDLLLSVSRLRRLPHWLPLRRTLLRAATLKRLANLSDSAPTETDPNLSLFDSQYNRSTGVLSPGVSMDGDGESSRWSHLRDMTNHITSTATGTEKANGHGQNAQKQPLPQPLPVMPAPANGQPHYAEAAEKKAKPRLAPARQVPVIEGGGNGSNGNGHGGTDTVTPWDDTRRQERTRYTHRQVRAGERDQTGE